MRLPITRHGTRELLFLGTPLLLATVALAALFLPLAVLPALLLVFLIAFFRDPGRRIAGGPLDIVSPADGVVADIATVDDPEYVGEPSVRIGIFLSVFNCHVNRSPVAGRVEHLRYQPGRFLDARSPRASAENESQSVGILAAAAPGVAPFRVLVRQISGAIARRIVCPLAAGAVLERGQRFGMIKFGSRTELFLPRRTAAELRVAKGARVKGGLTILASLAPSPAAVARPGAPS